MKEYSCLEECPLAAGVSNHRERVLLPQIRGWDAGSIQEENRAREGRVRCFQCALMQRRMLVTKDLNSCCCLNPVLGVALNFQNTYLSIITPLTTEECWNLGHRLSWGQASFSNCGYPSSLLQSIWSFESRQPAARGILFQRSRILL